MSIYWVDGRSYFVPNAGPGVRTQRNMPCFVRPAATSCPYPGLARDLTRIRPYFSNSRSGTLVSERHRELVRRTDLFAPCTVSDGFGGYRQFSVRSYSLKE